MTRPRTRTGFTLVEMMVVSVIIAIVMSVAVPRLGGTRHRVFENAVDAVADLLMMYAHRDTVGAKPVALAYDGPTRSLLLMVLEDSGDTLQPSGWIPDPFVRPVKLPPEVDANALLIMADGEPLDLGGPPLGHAPGDARPSIEIVLQSMEGDDSATLVLSPHAVSARRSDRDPRYAEREAVDLDAAGRSREDW